MMEFIQQMANFSLPEDECGDMDVDEYIADLDDERLYGEYSTFRCMIRAARELLA